MIPFLTGYGSGAGGVKGKQTPASCMRSGKKAKAIRRDGPGPAVAPIGCRTCRGEVSINPRHPTVCQLRQVRTSAGVALEMIETPGPGRASSAVALRPCATTSSLSVRASVPTTAAVAELPGRAPRLARVSFELRSKCLSCRPRPETLRSSSRCADLPVHDQPIRAFHDAPRSATRQLGGPPPRRTRPPNPPPRNRVTI
jgi:hypothetical protein